MSFAHIAVYPYILPYYRIMDHYWAAVTAFGQIPAPVRVQIDVGARRDRASTASSSRPAVLTPRTGPTPGTSTATSNGVGACPRSSPRCPRQRHLRPVRVGHRGTRGLTSDTATGVRAPWVGWTGLAPQFDLYTSAAPGSETEAAVVNGSGDSFTSGYGGPRPGRGVRRPAAGSGSPPGTASAIGDTVGQRIERLMRGGR